MVTNKIIITGVGFLIVAGIFFVVSAEDYVLYLKPMRQGCDGCYATGIPYATTFIGISLASIGILILALNLRHKPLNPPDTR